MGHHEIQCYLDIISVEEWTDWILGQSQIIDIETDPETCKILPVEGESIHHEGAGKPIPIHYQSLLSQN